MPRYRHDPSRDLVGFLVGDVMYAVRIDVVREIVNPLDVVDLPRGPSAATARAPSDGTKGVADYRGEVVPVIDLRERFALPPQALSRKTKWIVVDSAAQRTGPAIGQGAVPGARYAALVVDSVTEVFGLGGGELRPAPPLGEGDARRGIEGVTTLGDRLVFVLDARAFGAAEGVAARAGTSLPVSG